MLVCGGLACTRARKHLYSTGVNNSVLLNPMTLSAASHFADD